MSTLKVNGDSIVLSSQDEIQQIVGNGGVSIKINSLTDMNVDYVRDANGNVTNINNGDQRVLEWSTANGRFEVVDLDLGGGATALQPGDNVSELVNDAGYLTQETITLSTLKTEVAASTDFADFQARIAAL